MLMRRNLSPDLESKQREDLSQTAPAVRFPSPAAARRSASGQLLRLNDFLPRRWRRWVVIHGQSFWLPG
jgi:hypothetical protein